MSGFYFRGVRQASDGAMVPDMPIAQSAYIRIRERWSGLQFSDHNGVAIVGDQKEALLEELVVDDAMWQFWLCCDIKGENGELVWLEMSEREKLGLVAMCVRDGRWWRQWAGVNLDFGKWPWQKRLAFERTAVRESINEESPTPPTAEMDRLRREIAAKMVDWHLVFDRENVGLSPHDVPPAYVGLTFETI